MKSSVLSVVILGMIFQFMNFARGSTKENSSEDFVIAHDSIMFYRQKLNRPVCPIMPYDAGKACDAFLARKKEVDKSYVNSHRFISDVNEELMHFEVMKENFWPYESLQLVMQDDWDIYKKKLWSIYNSFHGPAYDEQTEKDALIKSLETFGDSSTYKPLFYKTLEERYHGDVKAYVNDLYMKSMMNRKKLLRRFIRRPTRKRLNDDLGAQMSIAVELYKFWLDNRKRIDERFTGNFVFRAKTVK